MEMLPSTPRPRSESPSRGCTVWALLEVLLLMHFALEAQAGHVKHCWLAVHSSTAYGASAYSTEIYVAFELERMWTNDLLFVNEFISKGEIVNQSFVFDSVPTKVRMSMAEQPRYREWGFWKVEMQCGDCNKVLLVDPNGEKGTKQLNDAAAESLWTPYWLLAGWEHVWNAEAVPCTDSDVQVSCSLSVHTMRRLYASLMRNDDAIMYVSFLVNGQWTTNEYLIDHVFRGRTVNRQYSLAAEPSMVKILVGEMRNGEWGIWKVTLTCACQIVLLESPNGIKGTKILNEKNDPLQNGDWRQYWIGDSVGIYEQIFDVAEHGSCTKSPTWTGPVSCELTVRTCDTSEGQMWIGEGFNVSFTVDDEESDSWYFHDGRLKQGEVSTKTFSLWGPPSKMSIRSDGEDRNADWCFWSVELDCGPCMKILRRNPNGEKGTPKPLTANQASKPAYYGWEKYWVGPGVDIEVQTFDIEDTTCAPTAAPTVLQAPTGVPVPTSAPTSAPSAYVHTCSPTMSGTVTAEVAGANAPPPPAPPSFPPGGGTECELEMSTSNAKHARTPDSTVLASFEVNGAWTEPEVYFDSGLKAGEVVSATFWLAGHPTKVKVERTENTNAWGFHRVTLFCACEQILLQDPNGVDGTEHPDEDDDTMDEWKNMYWLGDSSPDSHIWAVDPSTCTDSPTAPGPCSPTPAPTPAPRPPPSPPFPPPTSMPPTQAPVKILSVSPTMNLPCAFPDPGCTRSPTVSPTPMPTEPPTSRSPTKVTDSPSRMPTAPPTSSPTTSSPTTRSPSAAPTEPPTSAPTSAPSSVAPTRSPTTQTPTADGVTFAPTTTPTSSSPSTTSPTQPPTTRSPTTTSPSRSPTTRSPTSSPTFPPKTASPHPFCYGTSLELRGVIDCVTPAPTGTVRPFSISGAPTAPTPPKKSSPTGAPTPLPECAAAQEYAVVARVQFEGLDHRAVQADARLYRDFIDQVVAQMEAWVVGSDAVVEVRGVTGQAQATPITLEDFSRGGFGVPSNLVPIAPTVIVAVLFPAAQSRVVDQVAEQLLLDSAEVFSSSALLSRYDVSALWVVSGSSKPYKLPAYSNLDNRYKTLITEVEFPEVGISSFDDPAYAKTFNDTMAQLFATAAGLPLEHVRVQSVLAREYPPTGVVAEMWAVYPVHVDVTDTPKSLQDKLLTSTATVLGGTTINPYGRVCEATNFVLMANPSPNKGVNKVWSVEFGVVPEANATRSECHVHARGDDVHTSLQRAMAESTGVPFVNFAAVSCGNFTVQTHMDVETLAAWDSSPSSPALRGYSDVLAMIAGLPPGNVTTVQTTNRPARRRSLLQTSTQTLVTRMQVYNSTVAEHVKKLVMDSYYDGTMLEGVAGLNLGVRSLEMVGPPASSTRAWGEVTWDVLMEALAVEVREDGTDYKDLTSFINAYESMLPGYERDLYLAQNEGFVLAKLQEIAHDEQEMTDAVYEHSAYVSSALKIDGFYALKQCDKHVVYAFYQVLPAFIGDPSQFSHYGNNTELSADDLRNHDEAIAIHIPRIHSVLRNYVKHPTHAVEQPSPSVRSSAQGTTVAFSLFFARERDATNATYVLQTTDIFANDPNLACLHIELVWITTYECIQPALPTGAVSSDTVEGQMLFEGVSRSSATDAWMTNLQGEIASKATVPAEQVAVSRHLSDDARTKVHFVATFPPWHESPPAATRATSFALSLRNKLWRSTLGGQNFTLDWVSQYVGWQYVLVTRLQFPEIVEMNADVRSEFIPGILAEVSEFANVSVPLMSFKRMVTDPVSGTLVELAIKYASTHYAILSNGAETDKASGDSLAKKLQSEREGIFSRAFRKQFGSYQEIFTATTLDGYVPFVPDNVTYPGHAVMFAIQMISNATADALPNLRANRQLLQRYWYDQLVQTDDSVTDFSIVVENVTNVYCASAQEIWYSLRFEGASVCTRGHADTFSNWLRTAPRRVFPAFVFLNEDYASANGANLINLTALDDDEPGPSMVRFQAMWVMNVDYPCPDARHLGLFALLSWQDWLWLAFASLLLLLCCCIPCCILFLDAASPRNDAWTQTEVSHLMWLKSSDPKAQALSFPASKYLQSRLSEIVRRRDFLSRSSNETEIQDKADSGGRRRAETRRCQTEWTEEAQLVKTGGKSAGPTINKAAHGVVVNPLCEIAVQTEPMSKFSGYYAYDAYGREVWVQGVPHSTPPGKHETPWKEARRVGNGGRRADEYHEVNVVNEYNDVHHHHVVDPPASAEKAHDSGYHPARGLTSEGHDVEESSKVSLVKERYSTHREPGDPKQARERSNAAPGGRGLVTVPNGSGAHQPAVLDEDSVQSVRRMHNVENVHNTTNLTTHHVEHRESPSASRNRAPAVPAAPRQKDDDKETLGGLSVRPERHASNNNTNNTNNTNNVNNVHNVYNVSHHTVEHVVHHDAALPVPITPSAAPARLTGEHLYDELQGPKTVSRKSIEEARGGERGVHHVHNVRRSTEQKQAHTSEIKNTGSRSQQLSETLSADGRKLSSVDVLLKATQELGKVVHMLGPDRQAAKKKTEDERFSVTSDKHRITTLTDTVHRASSPGEAQDVGLQLGASTSVLRTQHRDVLNESNGSNIGRPQGGNATVSSQSNVINQSNTSNISHHTTHHHTSNVVHHVHQTYHQGQQLSDDAELWNNPVYADAELASP